MRKGVDEKDRAIIAMLKSDGRATMREIAKAVGMRPSTVHDRIKRMQERGVIKRFTIKVDDELLGDKLVVFMLVSGTADRYLSDDFFEHPAVRAIYGITGEYDLLIKLKFDTMRSFNRFVISFRERYSDHINKTVTMVQTTSLKEE